ncbi:MAG: UvrD-helicase domain-containing protein [Spirochaetaceae bacterium]|jgi:DNA helicase-2/ATP-dependent DNA helicase PcrA|nr:UvrD-helicase domain-containing protein [Spirochaetaceae bacterium]
MLNLEEALNGPQLEAVKALDGPVLIIAGAGSGKTRVITYRIAHMLERGIPQHSILALTFTNKAAREMEIRVKELTGKKLQNLTISTFHALGVKFLREEIEILGYRKNFSIYDETDRGELIRESLRECRMGEGSSVYALGQLFSNIKTGRYSWKDAPEIAGTAGMDQKAAAYEKVYREYQHSLKVFNALDFDDLLVLPIELFTAHPEILEKYRRRYRYIMVDEFQDTSLIQYRLIKLLMPDLRDRTSTANLCVVGDDDQSIYSWRGANYENLLMFEQDFPGAREIKLEQNYRSTTTILQAANGVISHNIKRKEKILWSSNSGGRPVEFFFPPDENGEGDFIAGKIKAHMMRDSLRYDDFGILVRTNSMSRTLEEVLLEANIPYKVSGGQSFFQRKEIKDILSYLRIIANTNDDINLLRIINTPRRGIGKTALQTISELARTNKTFLWEAMERLCRLPAGMDSPLPPKTRAELETFMNLVEAFRDRMLGDRKNLAEKTRNLTDHINYWSYLITEYSKNEKIARWKFANIEYFIRAIETWEKNPDTLDRGLYAWLNRVSLITSSDGQDDAGDQGKVSLMTIHSAKGLEFPVVFIAGAEEGIIPHTRSLEEEPEDGQSPLEEERRLFYVAITRARNKLYITSCKKRRRLQDTIDCAPSPFLAEIPPRLVEVRKGDDPVEDPKDAEAFFAKIKKTFT